MAINNIKIFDENKSNIMSTQEYSTNAQRLNGVQQGIASSMLQNKTLYQLSLVAYAIGQMMVNNGLDANDENAVSAFVGNLANTIVQKVVDKASTAEAQAGTDANKFMTPATTRAAINVLKATSGMATAGTDDAHWMTPALVKQMVDLFTTSADTIQEWIVSSINNNLSDDMNGTTVCTPSNKNYFGFNRGTKGVNTVEYTFNFSSLDDNQLVYAFSNLDLQNGGGAGSGEYGGNVYVKFILNNNTFDNFTINVNSSDNRPGSILNKISNKLVDINFSLVYGFIIKKGDILKINIDATNMAASSGSTNYSDLFLSQPVTYKYMIFN